MEFSAANFDEIITKADKVFQSTRPNAAIPSVSALGVDPLSGAVSLPGPSVLNEGFHQSFPQQQQLAAVSYGRGRGQRGNGRGQRGGRWGLGGRGGQNNGQSNGQSGSQNQSQSQAGSGSGKNKNTGEIHPRHGTARHSDLPPFKSCSRHWFFGKSAHFCEEPGTCPWKDVWIPKSNQ